jgi:hypothetical protein
VLELGVNLDETYKEVTDGADRDGVVGVRLGL